MNSYRMCPEDMCMDGFRDVEGLVKHLQKAHGAIRTVDSPTPLRDPMKSLPDAERDLADAERRLARAEKKVDRYRRGMATAITSLAVGAFLTFGSGAVADILPVLNHTSGTMLGLGIPTMILAVIFGFVWYMFHQVDEGTFTEQERAENAVDDAVVARDDIAERLMALAEIEDEGNQLDSSSPSYRALGQ